MKRIIYISLFLFVACLNQVNAQRTLEVHEMNVGNDSFEGSGREGGVMIRCNSDLILKFDSNYDENVVLEESLHDDESNESVYCLVFTQGKRILTIKAEGYHPVDISLNVVPNHAYMYKLTDPDDDSYFERQRKLGQSLFDQCDYFSAREAFLAASKATQATENEREEARVLVANCDSVMQLRKLAYLAADKLDYESACELFSRAMRYNPLDENFTTKYSDCSSLLDGACERYLSLGDAFFAKKEYADAIEMYRKVEDRRCDQAASALVNRLRAEELLKRKKNYDRYFGLEFGKLLGVTIATYRSTTGGYFTFKANSELFRLAQSDRRIDDHAAAEMNFGWTFPVYTPQKDIFRGVWLHAGLGGAVANQFKENEDDNSKLDMECGFAATPEAGVVVKIWHFALRVTAQYRFVFDEKYDDLFGPRRLSIGIGYCW